MGVRILHGECAAVLYCSTTDIAFGPVFYDSDDHTAEERAAAFTDWLPKDARQYSDNELMAKCYEFISTEKDYWKKQENKLDAD